jgi:hypothetical protein
MSLTCKECGAKDLEEFIDGLCSDCHRTSTEKWQAKLAIRQDPAQFDMRKLVSRLLTQHWMHECEIIPQYSRRSLARTRGRPARFAMSTRMVQRHSSVIAAGRRRGISGTPTARTCIVQRLPWLPSAIRLLHLV